MKTARKAAVNSEEKRVCFTRQLDALKQNLVTLNDGKGCAESLITLLLEELKLSVEMLTVQNEALDRLQEELAHSREETEQERKRYRDLIDHHPIGCLMTDIDGKIVDVNRETAAYLNLQEKMLIGKPMVLFIEESERRNFNQQIQGRFRASRRMRYRTRLQPSQKNPVDATLTVSAVENGTGRPSSLLFVLQTSETV